MKRSYLSVLLLAGLIIGFLSCNQEDFELKESEQGIVSLKGWYDNLSKGGEAGFLTKKGIEWDWDNVIEKEMDEEVILYILMPKDTDTNDQYKLMVISVEGEFDGVLYEYKEVASKKQTSLAGFFGKEIVYDMEGEIVTSKNLSGFNLEAEFEGIPDVESYVAMARYVLEGDSSNGWVWDSKCGCWTMQEYVVTFQSENLNKSTAYINWGNVMDYINRTYSPHNYYSVPRSVYGGGSTATSSSSEKVSVPGPDVPIPDIRRHLKCFSVASSSKNAEITIYINQPIANNSKPFSAKEDKAGHAFIGITQGDITRSFGLYPEGWANPLSPNDTRVFGNDSGDSFDVSITFTINSSQLKKVIEHVVAYERNYDLNSNNCTDFVLEISRMCGLSLPDPFSTWANGGGSSPGAFGEAVRGMGLRSGMTRNTEGGFARLDRGGC